MVLLLLNSEDASGVLMLLKNDGIKQALTGTSNDLIGTEPAKVRNLIYDAQGNVIFQDLPATDVFKSVQSLITR